MAKRPLFEAYDPDADTLRLEVQKPRFRYAVADYVAALLMQHDPDAEIVINRDFGRREAVQLPVCADGEVNTTGVTVYEPWASNRATVTIPQPAENAALTIAVLAYRTAQ